MVVKGKEMAEFLEVIGFNKIEENKYSFDYKIDGKDKNLYINISDNIEDFNNEIKASNYNDGTIVFFLQAVRDCLKSLIAIAAEEGKDTVDFCEIDYGMKDTTDPPLDKPWCTKRAYISIRFKI